MDANSIIRRTQQQVRLFTLTLLSISCAEDSYNDRSRTIPVDDANARVEVDSDESFGISGGVNVAAGDPLARTVVAVAISNGSLCSGSMISTNWVLTAGHCVTDLNGAVLPPDRLRILFNHVDVRSIRGTQAETVAQVVRAPTYAILTSGPNLTRVVDDVALIRLSRPMLDAIPARISAIPTESSGSLNKNLEDRSYQGFKVGTIGTSTVSVVDVAGYGVTSLSAKDSGILRSGRSRYNGVVLKLGSKFIEISADAANGASALTLSGDSGGPLFFPKERFNNRMIIAAVNSFTNGVSTGAEPIGDHLGWIRQYVADAKYELPLDETTYHSDIAPVYRAYLNDKGLHYFTGNKPEYESLLSAGWNGEGIGFFGHGLVTRPSGTEKRLPLIHMYNRLTSRHYYTTSVGETAHLEGLGPTRSRDPEGPVWQNHGNMTGVFLAPAAEAVNSREIFKLYNPNNNDGFHFYTSNDGERAYLVSIGYQQHTSLGFGPRDPNYVPPLTTTTRFTAPVTTTTQVTSASCQLRGTSNSYVTQSKDAIYYLRRGFSNTSGLNLVSNNSGFLRVMIPLTTAIQLGDACYCFNGVSPYNPSNLRVNDITIASRVSRCP
jgi:hypothetical protein